MSSDSMAKAKEIFRRSVVSGRVAQAVIVVGDVRGESMAFARFALSLLYKPGEGRDFRVETHPDIMFIEPQKKSRIISVEQVREAVRRMAQTSFAGGWKACIVMAADRLGGEASNAFLKTLEEPSGRSIFFLLTDRPDALLPTIRSRCMRIVLSEGGLALSGELRGELTGILAAADFRSPVNYAATAGRLHAVFERVKKEARKTAEKDADEDADDDTLDARAGAVYRETRNAALKLAMLWHRDILMWVCDPSGPALMLPEAAEQTRKQARSLDAGAALRNVEIIEAMRERFEENFDNMTVLAAGFGDMTSR